MSHDGLDLINPAAAASTTRTTPTTTLLLDTIPARDTCVRKDSRDPTVGSPGIPAAEEFDVAT